VQVSEGSEGESASTYVSTGGLKWTEADEVTALGYRLIDGGVARGSVDVGGRDHHCWAMLERVMRSESACEIGYVDKLRLVTSLSTWEGY
jgi:hypothetical protein